MILNGECDELPESAFLFAGTIEDVYKRQVLGGIRLDIEGTELDGTVQNRLSALRRDIASVTL